MSRRPARETIMFAVALAALATIGGIAAAGVASGATAAPSGDDHTPRQADGADAPNASIDYDGERLVVEQAADQRISGSTTLENGTQVTIRVRSSGSANPFLRSSVATVQPDGSFAARFDFTNVQRGTEFTVSVYYNGTELATAPGVVGGCDPTCGEPKGDAELGKNIYQTTAGEIVEMEVSMTNRKTATVLFGSDETSVSIPVTVTDGNDDGTVTVVIETTVDSLKDHGVYASADADSVRVHDDVDRPQSIEAGEYPVSLYLATQSERVEVDVGTVVLTEPTDDLGTTRGGDGTTTVGTIYGGPSTSTPGGDGGVSTTTIGILAVGGVLAVFGVAALVGAFD